MDIYDNETLKEITTQFPKDKSIQFLVRIIKEQKLERGKVENELEIITHNYNILYNKTKELEHRTREENKVLKSEQYNKQLIINNKILENKVEKLQNSNKDLIHKLVMERTKNSPL